jgi:hypothetical protein
LQRVRKHSNKLILGYKKTTFALSYGKALFKIRSKLYLKRKKKASPDYDKMTTSAACLYRLQVTLVGKQQLMLFDIFQN